MEDDLPQVRGMEDLLHQTGPDHHHLTDPEALQPTGIEADLKIDINLIIGIKLQPEQVDLVELNQKIRIMKRATRRQ